MLAAARMRAMARCRVAKVAEKITRIEKERRDNANQEEQACIAVAQNEDHRREIC